MILDRIVQQTRRRVADLPDEFPQQAEYPSRSLEDAINAAAHKNAIIAEIKYASPSRGILVNGTPPELLADELISGGCTALSVVTEPFFFRGSPEYLTRVKKCSVVPVLRKDFIVDERQIFESRALGADAVLLIAGVLQERLPHFVEICASVGIEPLVEVHTREEAEIAVKSGARLIGVNNRDLTTMKINLNTTRKLSDFVYREGGIVVSESGIHWPYDIGYLKKFCDAFLIGTSIMSAKSRPKRLEGFVYA